MKIKELLSDESKWTKGWVARDSDKTPVNALSEKAVCWCLEGAVRKCYSSETILCPTAEYFVKMNELSDAVHKKYAVSVPGFNDDDNTTFEQVKQLVEELDI